MDFCYNAIGGKDGANRKRMKDYAYGKVKEKRLGKLISNTGVSSSEGFFSITKIFFLTLVLCMIVYMTIQLIKKKYDKKYIIALYVVLVAGFVGILIKNFLTPPYSYIVNSILLGGSILTIFILNILMGRDKF